MATKIVPRNQPALAKLVNAVDPLGRQIQPRVLSVGQEIAPQAVSYAQKSLADPCVAVNLLEEAAATVSEAVLAKHQRSLRTVWRLTLRRAKVPYFRLYDLRSTYATRLSAGGVADEWVTQLLRQSDSKVFKKYSQMKLRMQREALEKMNRQANEMTSEVTTAVQESKSLCTVPAQF